ncbi:MAG: homogentisate phytyltransferase [Cyanobacteria bacterium P01_A01_bin.17]
MKQTRQWLAALWKFSRPHTIIGTSLSVWGLALITLSVLSLSQGFLETLGQWLPLIIGAWIPCLCGNIYIVGLNQLTDVGIDRINKPNLPLASGAFSPREGVGIVSVSGLLALLLAGFQGPYLLGMVAASLAIGTAYSLPPIRLKRFAFWAALCIFGVRGVIVNLGLFWHFHQLWTGEAGVVPPQVWMLTGFIVVYTFAIAIFKDIPDLEGDRKFRIRTLTVRLGGQTVFNLALGTITACYSGMMIAAAFILPLYPTLLIVLSHLGLLLVLWQSSKNVNLRERQTVRQFYQLIWKLFFIEYLLFPLACLWR